MAATVGGRMEEVRRPPSLFGPDYIRLAGLVLVAVAVHAWLISHTALTARDGLGFARLALCFETPSAAPPREDGKPKNTLDHIREAQHPPGYPLAVWATDGVLRHASDRPVPDRVLLACQVANALAAVLLVIPTYLIGRMLFSRNVGFAAALLFQVLPVPARITSDALTEGVYLLATSVAILLAVQAVRRPRVSGFLLCGLATGAAYLVRPEGLMVAAGPGAVALWLGLTRAWPRDAAFGRISALVVGVALVAVPYMAVIGKLTNKTSGKEMLNPVGPPRSIYHNPEGTSRAATGLPLFAEWWNDARDGGKCRELWAVQSVAKEMSKGGNYFVWPLALLAAVVLRRKFASDPGVWVLGVLIACNTVVLVYLAERVGYVSERHTVLLTLVACILAAAGLPQLAAGLGQLMPRVERFGVRITAASILVALVASSLPFALKPMHPHREGHKRAGLWLAERITDNDAMVDPFCWAEWYAGRTLYRTSWNPSPSNCTYVIWENKSESPHSRLPVLPEAERLKNTPGARIVYQWPEGAPADQPTVQVWKLGGE